MRDTRCSCTPYKFRTSIWREPLKLLLSKMLDKICIMINEVCRFCLLCRIWGLPFWLLYDCYFDFTDSPYGIYNIEIIIKKVVSNRLTTLFFSTRSSFQNCMRCCVFTPEALHRHLYIDILHRRLYISCRADLCFLYHRLVYLRSKMFYGIHFNISQIKMLFFISLWLPCNYTKEC